MLKKALGGVVSFTLACTGAMSLLACNPSSTSPSTGQTQGAGSKDRLTSAEWSAYVADAQYVRGLSKPNVPVQLNLADPRQYNFAIARLKLAGKNATNSPYLFELIETRRQAQLASGLKAGTVVHALASTGEAIVGEPIAMHYIEAADVGNSQAQLSLAGARKGTTAAAATAPEASGTASSTFPGGTDYTYVDVSISTIGGDAIAPLAYKEDYGNPDGSTGANVTISTAGDTSVSSLTRYTFESYQYQQVGEDFLDSYVHTEVGSLAAQAPVGLPQLSVPAVDAPVDLVGPNNGAPDGTISVCVDRAWTNDCDYILNTGTSGDHRIKMPLKGAVTLTTAHVFDLAAIQQLQTALKNNQPPPSWGPGQVKLVLTNAGGGCDVDAANALYAGMSGFWNYVTLSADSKTFYWDVTGVNAIFFDQGCTQIQNNTKLTMRIPMPVLSVPGNVPFTASFTISDDPSTLRPDATLPPIKVTNSCLAEGTQIQLSGGKLAPIEALHIGQSVFNPYAANGNGLTIKDTAVGNERAPMVHIRDEAGHTLLMTEMHPIATPDRGMVQARALRTGDIVMTTEGPSKLIEVSREPYGGKVYNLKIGSETEMANLGQDQTVVYANGFVVGDGQIQSKYEEMSIKQGSKTTLAQVPERWRRDYLFATSRK